MNEWLCEIQDRSLVGMPVFVAKFTNISVVKTPRNEQTHP